MKKLHYNDQWRRLRQSKASGNGRASERRASAGLRLFMFSTAVYKRASEEMPVCNESNIIEYSDLCLNEDPPQDCYPSLESTPHVTALSLIFHSFNIFLGLAGNLLTLLSIPYARYRRRFGFQVGNSSITINWAIFYLRLS